MSLGLKCLVCLYIRWTMGQSSDYQLLQLEQQGRAEGQLQDVPRQSFVGHSGHMAEST